MQRLRFSLISSLTLSGVLVALGGSCTGKPSQPAATGHSSNGAAPAAKAAAADRAYDRPEVAPAPGTTPRQAPRDAPAADAEAGADGVEAFEKPTLVAERDAGVTVSNAGAEPRAVLALRPTAGQTQVAPVHLTMRLSVGVAGNVVPPTDIPAIDLRVETKVAAVTPGEVTVQLSTAEAVADGDVPSDRVRKALAQAVKHLSDASATIAFSRTGGATAMAMEGIGDGSTLKPSLDGLFDTLRPMFVTLPTQAVGVGARWEVVTHREEGGANIQQVVRYELTEVRGDSISVSWQTDRGTTAVGPSEGAGIEAHAAAGKGITVFDLAAASPVSSTADINTRTHARVKFGQSASPVMVHQLTRLSLGEKP